MNPVGRHTAPIDGTVTANGHALAPFTITPALQVQRLAPVARQQDDRPAPRRAVSARVIESCYVTMAAVTVVATGVGFWLSYAGLHSFAVLAGLSGPEAWAWPASVDLFILAGELGITISTLRDGRPDWRAWGYFAAGCGPSVTFNVLHVAGRFPAWGKYAVAATPPVAAVLALAALMQQVISLPDALAHMHARQGDSSHDSEHDRDLPWSRAAAPGGNCGIELTPERPPARAARDKGDKTRATTPARPMTKQASAAAVIRDNPGLTNEELAALAGCKVRTIQRARNGTAKTP